MAIQELISYSAQKVVIKALRGNYFHLVINIKTSSGADFDFTNSSTETDNGFFQVIAPGGTPLVNNYSTYQGSALVQQGEVIEFETTVEDGKITIKSINDNGFWPTPGTYKYNVFTQLVDSNTTSDQLTHWLYGDFVVIDDNPSTNLGGVPTAELGFFPDYTTDATDEG